MSGTFNKSKAKQNCRISPDNIRRKEIPFRFLLKNQRINKREKIPKMLRARSINELIVLTENTEGNRKDTNRT